ncbi:hypothetical protein [Sulfurospirillum oryzae]|uniref:hypothetical protein n=1 Tax=Sulfurospirillum oryzae TaxID=2976535 RepID=UPI0021E6FB3B|nr:hypothetical protein [Sulfurospirillum oryzae]
MQKTISKLFDVHQNTISNWKKEEKRGLSFFLKYFKKEELEEFIQTGKMQKLENIKIADLLYNNTIKQLQNINFIDTYIVFLYLHKNINVSIQNSFNNYTHNLNLFNELQKIENFHDFYFSCLDFNEYAYIKTTIQTHLLDFLNSINISVLIEPSDENYMLKDYPSNSMLDYTNTVVNLQEFDYYHQALIANSYEHIFNKYFKQQMIAFHNFVYSTEDKNAILILDKLIHLSNGAK